MAEHWSPKPGAVGSNPTGPATLVALFRALNSLVFRLWSLNLSGSVGCESAMFKKLTKFLREVKLELKKVSWPSRREISGSTGVVILNVVFVAVYLGIVDNILQQLMRVVHRFAG